MNSLKVSDLLRFGWEKTKENWKVLFVVAIMTIILNAAEFFVPESGIGSDLLIVVLNTLFIALSVAATKLLLNIVDGKSKGLNDLTTLSFMTYMKFIGGTILYILLVMLGLLVLVLPGIYLAVRYQYYSSFIIDKNEGVIEALKHSSDITAGVWWKVFGYGIAIYAINILGVLALGIGLFITVPISMIALTKFYRDLEKGHYKHEIKIDKELAA